MAKQETLIKTCRLLTLTNGCTRGFWYWYGYLATISKRGSKFIKVLWSRASGILTKFKYRLGKSKHICPLISTFHCSHSSPFAFQNSHLYPSPQHETGAFSWLMQGKKEASLNMSKKKDHALFSYVTYIFLFLTYLVPQRPHTFLGGGGQDLHFCTAFNHSFSEIL